MTMVLSLMPRSSTDFRRLADVSVVFHHAVGVIIPGHAALYHLNAEQEPEMPYWPKDDPEFLKV
jgi:hypothetical protein